MTDKGLAEKEKVLSEMMEKIEKLWETDIGGIPEGSRFLLEIGCDKLIQSDIHNILGGSN